MKWPLHYTLSYTDYFATYCNFFYFPASLPYIAKEDYTNLRQWTILHTNWPLHYQQCMFCTSRNEPFITLLQPNSLQCMIYKKVPLEHCEWVCYFVSSCHVPACVNNVAPFDCMVCVHSILFAVLPMFICQSSVPEAHKMNETRCKD